eukprot:953615-Amphidinium_carterae.1
MEWTHRTRAKRPKKLDGDRITSGYKCQVDVQFLASGLVDLDSEMRDLMPCQNIVLMIRAAATVLRFKLKG